MTLQLMKMWSRQNQLFIICIVLRYSTDAADLIHVAGYQGREVEVFCPYENGYESYQKYLCKESCGYDDVLVETGGAKRDRYSIYDNKEKKIFTVNISGLSLTDAGKYWCGVTRTGKDLYTEVKLKVVPDRCCDNVNTVQGYVEASTSISCPYHSKYQHNLKYFCRGSQPSTCLQQAVITSDHNQNGRFNLHDDKASSNFTVTIASLTQEDSGLYLCGVRDINSLDVFSLTKLDVKDAAHVSSADIVVPVSVAVVLTLLAFALVMVYRWKCYKVPGAGVNMNRNTRKTDEICGNQEVVACTKLGSSKQQCTLHQYDDAEDQQESDYQNLMEDIYCNQIVINCNKASRN
ncbi:polymeric immunoglobulin receptor-like [Centroberyx affinis]|uniref:polymeric immunoglobulin receptor-like n=1 Tax=Centroberyx affinis TaxID=166261 RepID=UPI003A5BA260